MDKDDVFFDDIDAYRANHFADYTSESISARVAQVSHDIDYAKKMTASWKQCLEVGYDHLDDENRARLTFQKGRNYVEPRLVENPAYLRQQVDDWFYSWLLAQDELKEMLEELSKRAKANALAELGMASQVQDDLVSGDEEFHERA